MNFLIYLYWKILRTRNDRFQWRISISLGIGKYCQSAVISGYAFGLNPTADFATILESCDISAMQNSTAKKYWPSTILGKGITYPTWGATHGNILNPDNWE